LAVGWSDEVGVVIQEIQDLVGVSTEGKKVVGLGVLLDRDTMYGAKTTLEQVSFSLEVLAFEAIFAAVLGLIYIPPFGYQPQESSHHSCMVLRRSAAEEVIVYLEALP
jgi:hypothetical protein